MNSSSIGCDSLRGCGWKMEYTAGVGMIIPNIWKVIKPCSKPPTRLIMVHQIPLNHIKSPLKLHYSHKLTIKSSLLKISWSFHTDRIARARFRDHEVDVPHGIAGQTLHASLESIRLFIQAL